MHYFYYKKGDKQSLPAYLSDWQGVQWPLDWTGWVNVNGRETVSAVLTALMAETSLSGLLKAAVAFGGDTDTTGALVLALGSLSEAWKPDLPDWMYEGLERGAYGSEYLQDLDRNIPLHLPLRLQ